MEHLKLRLIKYHWKLQVWLCRRFMRNLTLGKACVLADVTGAPIESILKLHRGSVERAGLTSVV